MSHINRKDFSFIYPEANEIILFTENGSFAEISRFWFGFCHWEVGGGGARYETFLPLGDKWVLKMTYY